MKSLVVVLLLCCVFALSGCDTWPFSGATPPSVSTVKEENENQIQYTIVVVIPKGRDARSDPKVGDTLTGEKVIATCFDGGNLISVTTQTDKNDFKTYSGIRWSARVNEDKASIVKAPEIAPVTATPEDTLASAKP